ncbi:MAG: hypothetical protein K2J73_06530 [Oscillospiraceae bacterium]|nr:hypothetical protein [Oscillospiraceae bacterium]
MKSPIKSVPAGGRLNLFFMEMIIVLLFFGIASAVILNAFAASDRLSRESGWLERMSFCAQSAAEVFSATGSLSETAEELFGLTVSDSDEVVVPLDEGCVYSPESAALLMTMTVSEDKTEGLMEMHIVFTDGNDESGETLYEVRSGAYLPPKRAVNGIGR